MFHAGGAFPSDGGAAAVMLLTLTVLAVLAYTRRAAEQSAHDDFLTKNLEIEEQIKACRFDSCMSALRIHWRFPILCEHKIRYGQRE